LLLTLTTLGTTACAVDTTDVADEADLTATTRKFHMNAGVELGKLAKCSTTDRACYLSPDFENAEWLAEFSKLIYLDDVDEAHPEKAALMKSALVKLGITPTEFVLFDHSLLGSHAAYFEVGDMGVLVFRGTRTDRWQDIAADAKLKKDNGIHHGFVKLFLGIWTGADYNPEQLGDVMVRSDLGDYLSERFAGAKRPRSLYITGHSLGAALATVTLHELLVTGVPIPEKTAVYSFGTPRVGDATFAESLWNLTRKANIPYYRFVHRGDIVTNLAPKELGYVHVGRPVSTDSEDGLDTFIHFAESGAAPVNVAPIMTFGARVPGFEKPGMSVGDHAMATYAPLLHAYAAKHPSK
jgi:hypothetical protein